MSMFDQRPSPVIEPLLEGNFAEATFNVVDNVLKEILRPETPEEREARLAQEKKDKQEKEAQELKVTKEGEQRRLTEQELRGRTEEDILRSAIMLALSAPERAIEAVTNGVDESVGEEIEAVVTNLLGFDSNGMEESRKLKDKAWLFSQSA